MWMDDLLVSKIRLQSCDLQIGRNKWVTMCLAFTTWDLDYQSDVIGKCYYAQIFEER